MSSTAEVGKGEERVAVFQTAEKFCWEITKKLQESLGKLRSSKAAGHGLFLLNHWKMGNGDEMKTFTSYFYWLGGLKQTRKGCQWPKLHAQFGERRKVRVWEWQNLLFKDWNLTVTPVRGRALVPRLHSACPEHRTRDSLRWLCCLQLWSAPSLFPDPALFVQAGCRHTSPTLLRHYGSCIYDIYSCACFCTACEFLSPKPLLSLKHTKPHQPEQSNSWAAFPIRNICLLCLKDPLNGRAVRKPTIAHEI